MASVPEIPSDFRDHIVKKCPFFCFVLLIVYYLFKPVFVNLRFLWTSKEIEDSRKPLKNSKDYLSKMKERRFGILIDTKTSLGVERLFFILLLMHLPSRDICIIHLHIIGQHPWNAKGTTASSPPKH